MIPTWTTELVGLALSAFVAILIQRYLANSKRFVAWVTSVGLLWVALQLWNKHQRDRMEATKPVFYGELTPASSYDDPRIINPALNCVALLLGDNRILAARSEHTVLAVGGRPLIRLGLRQGRLSLTAWVLDSQGRNVVSIIDNEFQADPHNAFLPRRPDPHSLLVRDLHGVEVLNLRFLSPRVVALTGRFYHPGLAGPVEISDKGGIRWGRSVISGNTIDMTRGGNFLTIK